MCPLNRREEYQNKSSQRVDHQAKRCITTQDILNFIPSKPVPKEIEKCFIRHSQLPNNIVQLPTNLPQVREVIINKVINFS